MNHCTFVRKNCSGYEYGHIVVENHATRQEKRHHVVLGKADTYEAALAANDMAQKGLPRASYHGLDLKPLWKN